MTFSAPASPRPSQVTFRRIVLEIGPGAFMPQPETSAVVQWVVDELRRGSPSPWVVDLCTGAGTIALAVAHEVPTATVHAVERDADAHRWAERNADRRAGDGDTRVQLHLDDASTCLRELDGTFDLVVSNPPYVATTEAHIPSQDVLDHDPAIALWAGDDGLDVIRLVERTGARLLKPGGVLVIEHSDRQGRAVPALLEGAGPWFDVADHRDDDGRDRFATARRA